MKQIRAAVFATVWWLGCCDDARATTFIPVTVENLTRSSLAAVTGTIAGLTGVEAADGDIYTLVEVDIEEVLKGDIKAPALTLKEDGGALGGRQRVVFGAPRFRVGERVMLFLTARPDGSLRTNHLALGKFRIDDSVPEPEAYQELEPGTTVIVPPGSEPPCERRPVRRLRAAVAAAVGRAGPGGAPGSFVLEPPEARDPALSREVSDEFTLMGNGRFFEPDTGIALYFSIDQRGDAILGLTPARVAVDEALAAWTDVASASISLLDGGLTGDLTPPGPAEYKVRFNDPDGEIPDPIDCSGTLGVGGFTHTNDETKFFNGTLFTRSLSGSLTLANGFEGCADWHSCNVAEVAAHELGHVIGLGHSSEDFEEADATLRDATMYFLAHFDGRCAGLRADDTQGVSFIYPAAVPPTIITPDPLPPGLLRVEYAVALAAAGGNGPMTWTLESGEFPGLALSPDGVVSGTPQAYGNGIFTIKATDRDGNSHTKKFHIEVSQNTPTPTATGRATVTPTPTGGATTPTATPVRTATPTTTSNPTVTATARPTLPGDADCDSALTSSDVAAAAVAIFDPLAVSRCAGAECNGDGSIGAADLPCVIAKVAG